MNCYWCKVKLTTENRSKEHIIPNFLGGRKSYYLLCKKHNGDNSFANALDIELAKQIGMFADVLNVKRDRPKKSIEIPMIDKNGKEFRYGPKLVPKPYLENQLLNKDHPIIIWGKNDQNLLNYIEKYRKKIEKKYGQSEIIQSAHEPGKRHFINNLSNEPEKFAFGGVLFERGIGKIILNYYLSDEQKLFEPNSFIKFVKGDVANQFFVNPYYPDHYKIHELGADEISHVLFLRGDSKNRQLIGYVELFSTFNFICRLSDNYIGKDFEMSYCYDLIHSTEIKKEVKIRLSRNHFNDMNVLALAHKGKASKNFQVLMSKIENLQESD